MKAATGKPGTRDISMQMPPPTSSTRGWAVICLRIASPRCLSSSSVVRVTIRPAAIAPSSAGICATMPSPMVRMEYLETAVPMS